MMFFFSENNPEYGYISPACPEHGQMGVIAERERCNERISSVAISHISETDDQINIMNCLFLNYIASSQRHAHTKGVYLYTYSRFEHFLSNGPDQKERQVAVWLYSRDRNLSGTGTHTLATNRAPRIIGRKRPNPCTLPAVKPSSTQKAAVIQGAGCEIS